MILDSRQAHNPKRDRHFRASTARVGREDPTPTAKPGLARAPTNLGNQLGAVGRREEALAAAVTRLRRRVTCAHRPSPTSVLCTN